MTKSKPKVAVMLSGGVDSAVSAALLKKRGFRVAGIFMKNWSEDLGQGCPWIDDQRCARQVARHLGIAFYTFNFERVYKQKVIAPFLRGSAQGLTPNPDITCNEEIKFKVFIAKARALGFSHFATGHYARLRRGRGGVRLLAGRDLNKDQSYFLARVSPRIFNTCFFPIGQYTKSQVRALAEEFGLPNAARPDSQGLCFVGKINVRTFLKKSLNPQPGPITDTDGRVVGRHEGLALYTIGQRQGLKIGGGVPYYVVAKDLARNTLIVGRGRANSKLYRREIGVINWHWCLAKAPHLPMRVRARLRYRQPLSTAVITRARGSGVMQVRFAKPQFAPAAGQSLVAYLGQTVVGSGIIEQ